MVHHDNALRRSLALFFLCIIADLLIHACVFAQCDDTQHQTPECLYREKRNELYTLYDFLLSQFLRDEREAFILSQDIWEHFMSASCEATTTIISPPGSSFESMTRTQCYLQETERRFNDLLCLLSAIKKQTSVPYSSEALEAACTHSLSPQAIFQAPFQTTRDPYKRFREECEGTAPESGLKRALQRYRIIADFNNDSLDDLALSDDINMFGNAGGFFAIFIALNETEYRYLGDIFAHPMVVQVAKIQNGVGRIENYHRLGPRSGAFVEYQITDTLIRKVSKCHVHLVMV